mmetsp:Transcript_3720/g.6588  ORF Transcript_3720/g.6588 Transcript_3720/m.6588 type:complete len:200 (-) Transcript_3720:517-1116(-)
MKTCGTLWTPRRGDEQLRRDLRRSCRILKFSQREPKMTSAKRGGGFFGDPGYGVGHSGFRGPSGRQSPWQSDAGHRTRVPLITASFLQSPMQASDPALKAVSYPPPLQMQATSLAWRQLRGSSPSSVKPPGRSPDVAAPTRPSSPLAGPPSGSSSRGSLGGPQTLHSTTEKRCQRLGVIRCTTTADASHGRVNAPPKSS